MKERLKHLVTHILVWEARRAIRIHHPKIVMIAGSVGKTSTKDAVAAVLATKFRVRKSEKSFNSDLGVPLAILGLENGWGNPFKWLRNMYSGWKASHTTEFPEILVLEVGADHPGDIRTLLKWVRPHVSVMTSFPDTPVHVEFFPSREALWDEDAEIIRTLPVDGILVGNGDDTNLASYLASSRLPVLTYGLVDGNAVYGSRVHPYIENDVLAGMEMEVMYGKERVMVRVPGILGDQLCYSVLAGIALGTRFGVPLTGAAEAFSSSELPKGRMRIHAGVSGSTLIDDTYNSSPVALTAALHALESLESKGKKIVVLGDMRELGGYSVTEHRKAGLLAGNIADVVIGVGESAKDLVESAKGKKASIVEWYATAVEAGETLLPRVRAGDVILVKGSQGVRMEKCAAILLANREDREHLPRQEKEWRKR